MPTPREGDRLGRYRVDAPLGMGGMGVVFTATDLELGRKVALKVVSDRFAEDEEFRKRFHREAETLGRLDSPHVITIFEHGEHDGVPYIATQFVSGGDLSELIGQRGALPPALAARICAQLADALHDAHRSGVIHRDVKPANVLIRDPDAKDLHAYLCDFGIAATETGGLTAAGSVPGTWAYLAPERAEGQPATPSTDIYSLGCLLWTCLTTRPPYDGTDVKVAIAHVNAPVPQLAGHDPYTRRLNAVLAQALAKDPAQRFPSAAAFKDALVELADPRSTPPATLTPPGRPDGPGQRSASTTPTSPALGSKRRRRSTLYALIAAVAVAVIGIAAIVWAVLPDEKAKNASPDDQPSVSDKSSDDPAPPGNDSTGAADFNGDGLGDFPIHTFDRDTQVVYLPSDGALFGDAVAASETVGIQLAGDVDGDGTEELVAVRNSVDKPYEVTVAGSETVKLKAAGPQAGVLYPFLGDFDGDGLDDLAVPSAPGSTSLKLWVALSDGKGGFGQLKQWFDQKRGYDTMLPGDFDGDGDGDILIPVEDGEGYDVLVSDGSSFTVTAQAFYKWLIRPRSGDFDGDGTDEVIGIRNDDLWVLSDFRSGVFGVDEWGAVIDAGDLLVGDYDGDGYDDVAAIGGDYESAQDIVVYTSDGESFSEGETWATYDCDCAGSYIPITSSTY